VGGKRVVELTRFLTRYLMRYQYLETSYCIRKGILGATARRWWWRRKNRNRCIGLKPFLFLRIARIV
jgi:hypothetical protein